MNELSVSVLTSEDKGHNRKQLSAGTHSEHYFSVLRSIVTTLRHLFKALFLLFPFLTHNLKLKNVVLKETAAQNTLW